MNFNINNYNGKYAMHCKTEAEAKDFCNYLHSIGKRWNNVESYLNNPEWYKYTTDSVYLFNSDLISYTGFAKRNNYTILEWSDFMNKEFTRADLKTGDVVKFRNGEIGIVNGKLKTIIMKDKFACICHFTENLMYDGMNSKGEDIVAVRRPESVYHCQFCAFEREYGILVYERKEVEEMTLAEVCRLLGKEIKIIK